MIKTQAYFSTADFCKTIFPAVTIKAQAYFSTSDFYKTIFPAVMIKPQVLFSTAGIIYLPISAVYSPIFFLIVKIMPSAILL
jgi:hypothetical protein